MLEEESTEQAFFFKEYQCLEFKWAEKQVERQLQAAFVETANADPDLLPTALLDRLAGREELHLLLWERAETGWLLLTKRVAEQRWTELRLKLLPETVAVAGGVLYLQAGREVAVVSLGEPYHDFRRLPEGRVVALGACAVEYYAGRYEAGVSAVLFHERSGYQTVSFSPRRRAAQEQGLLRQLSSLLAGKTAFQQFRHFEVILPGQLALVFHSESRFSLFDLHRLEVAEGTESRLVSGRLTAGEGPVVRWREHVPVPGFSKGVILTVCAGSNLEVFFLNFRFRAELEEGLANVALPDVHGDVLDWASMQLAPFVCLAVPGRVVDVGISKKGLLCYSRESRTSEIGHCSYRDLNWAFLEAPVLTQEATVWRTYYEDRELPDLDANRYFLPNRYPPEMVIALLAPDHTHSDKLRPQLLNAWRTSYRFKAILAFSEEMLIVRTGSLSAFRLLPPDLFRLEHFSEQQLDTLQQLECKAASSSREVENVFAKPDEQFLEPPFWGLMDRPVAGERRYSFVRREDYSELEQAEEHASERFEELLGELEEVVRGGDDAVYATVSLPQLQLPLALALLADQLAHYHLTANSKTFRIDPEAPRQGSKHYELQACVAALVGYFHGLLGRAERHFWACGEGLLGRFAQSHRECLSADLDRSVRAYLRLLFQNLLPLKTTNYLNSQILPEDPYDTAHSRNAYADFLVEELLDALREGREGREGERAAVLREELGLLLGVGFLECGSIFFAHFWRNESLFRALLLSDSPSLSVCLAQLLLKKQSHRLLAHYSALKEYMLPAQAAAAEHTLFFAQGLHALAVDVRLLQNHHRATLDNELETHPDLTGLLREEICAQASLNTTDRDTARRAETALREIAELGKREVEVERARAVQATVRGTFFADPEQQLQFLEDALKHSLKVFNGRVVMEEWTPLSEEPSEEQQMRLRARKEELVACLDLVELCFQGYKRVYRQVYEEGPVEEEREVSVSEAERHYNFEMVLLDHRFLTASALRFEIDSHTLPCCSQAIHLLRDALSFFGDSLQVVDNLVGFWLGREAGEDKEGLGEGAVRLELAYGLDPQAAAGYLLLNEDARARARRVYEWTAHEGEYQFFRLFATD